jgi:hypothetical protein
VLLLTANGALTAELGRVDFQGKTIILFDDGTWREAAAGTTEVQGCGNGVKIASKRLPIAMCFDSATWVRENAGASWEDFFRNKDATLYGGTITEIITIDEAFLRNAIVQNAANGAKIDVSQVKVMKEEKLPINGQTWSHIEYGVPLAGNNFVYSNYYISIPGKGTAQILFFTTDALFEAGRPAMEKVVATFTVGEGGSTTPSAQ